MEIRILYRGRNYAGESLVKTWFILEPIYVTAQLATGQTRLHLFSCLSYHILVFMTIFSTHNFKSLLFLHRIVRNVND